MEQENQNSEVNKPQEVPAQPSQPVHQPDQGNQPKAPGQTPGQSSGAV